jgi:hypothetical protein
MGNLLEKEVMGSIHLGDKVRVSDPCYDLDVWCAGSIENVLPGEYTCFMQKEDTGDWGIRVSKIEVRHKDYLDVEPTEIQEFEVGVDSGQAGIYDQKYYEELWEDKGKQDEWYSRVCDLTAKYIPNSNYHDLWSSSFYYNGVLGISDDEWEKMSISERVEAESNIRKALVANNTWLDKFSEAHKKYNESSESTERFFEFSSGTIDDKGFASSSGDGDGGYTCFVGRNKEGKVISIKIDYYYYEDDEEE